MRRTNIRIRKQLLAAAIVLLAVVPAHRVLAQAERREPDLESTPTALTGDYQVGTELVLTGEITVSGRNVNFGIGFDAGQNGTYAQRTLKRESGTGTLSYQILDSVADDNDIRDLDGDSSGESLLVDRVQSRGPNRTTQTVTFDVRIPIAPVAQEGVYSDVVKLTLYHDDGGYVYREDVMMTISVNVIKEISVVIVGAGGPFEEGRSSEELFFGSLTRQPPPTQEVDLLVRANNNYELSLESMQNGVLRHIAEPSSTIGYTLRVNGSSVNLTGGTATIAQGSGPTPTGGDRYALFFEILPAENPTSGEYRDDLLVIVTTQ